jgi:two-component system, OmpR family, response regulator
VRILVVDDEPDLVEVVSEIFRSRGHTVDTATNVVRARARATTDAYDAIVVDMAVPKVMGLDLYQALEREGSVVLERMIVICAVSTPTLRAGFGRVPPWAFIEKPFSVSRLVEALERLPGARS